MRLYCLCGMDTLTLANLMDSCHEAYTSRLHKKPSLLLFWQKSFSPATQTSIQSSTHLTHRGIYTSTNNRSDSTFPLSYIYIHMDPAPSHGLPQTLPSTHDQSAYTDTSASTIESSTAATTTNYTSPGTPQDQVARHMITNFDVASLNSKLQGIALTNRGHSDTPGAAVPPPASVTSEPISSLDDDVNPDIVAKYAQSSIDGLLTASMLQDIWGLGMLLLSAVFYLLTFSS